MRQTMKVTAAALLTAGTAICALGSVGIVLGLRVNTSPSMPLGLWYEHASAGHSYAAGDVVEVCPPMALWQTYYLRPGECPGSGREPILKTVAAVPSDIVDISPNGMLVNGIKLENTSPLSHDGVGRPLAAYPLGVYTTQPGTVWLVAPRWDSYDSRYFGPVSIEDIKGLAEPVWLQK
jgi:conjugative transfer signal peptidase TraF